MIDGVARNVEAFGIPRAADTADGEDRFFLQTGYRHGDLRSRTDTHDDHVAHRVFLAYKRERTPVYERVDVVATEFGRRAAFGRVFSFVPEYAVIAGRGETGRRARQEGVVIHGEKRRARAYDGVDDVFLRRSLAVADQKNGFFRPEREQENVDLRGDLAVLDGFRAKRVPPFRPFF